MSNLISTIKLIMLSLVLSLTVNNSTIAQDRVLDSINNYVAGLNQSEKTDTLKSLALQFRNSSLHRALFFAEARKDIVEESGSDSLKADNLNLFGNIYLSSGLYEQAQNKYMESLSLHKEINNYNGCATETHNLGLLFYKQSDTIKAIDYFKQSHNYRLKTKNNRRIGDGLTTLGEIYLTYGYYDKSISALSSAINYYKDQLSYHRKYDCLAYLFDNFILFDSDIAMEWLKRMEELYLLDTTKVFINPNRIDLRRAQYYIKEGDLESAIVSFRDADIESYQFDNEYIPWNLMSDFKELLAVNGEIKLSLYFSELSRNINRETYNKKLRETISSYKTRLNLRTTNEEALRTKELNSIILKRIHAERIINTSMLVVISILFFLLFALIYNLLRIRRSQHILNLRNTDLKKAYNKNISYKEKTIKIKEDKNTFFRIISGKLALPFNELNKSLQELSDKTRESFDKEKFLTELHESYDLAVSLERSLKRILLWSKLQRNNYEVRSEEFLINDYAHELLPEFLSISVHKNIKISFDIDSDLSIYYDKKSLRSILKVLIENSVDNSEKETDIIIRGKMLSKEKYISVTDFGSGIPLNKQNTIFDIDKASVNYTKPGNKNRLGIGLLLAKRLAELNNSRLYFESKVKKGTTFYIQI